MEKYFGEKQERFSFRKLSVGLVSATISSLFFMSVLASSSVDAQETAGVHYKYVADSELSSEEKKQLVYDIPTYVENDDETYYLVYKLNSQNQLAELPNTGSKNERQALVAGASLAALGILIFAVSKKKVKNKTVLHLVLVAGIGNGVLVSVHALENHLLLNYNTDYELTSGEKLPLPKEISGYTYIGYIKEGKTTSDFEVSNQEKSAATPTKQQKVDYNVTPNFVDHPSTVQAIQEQTPVSSTKPTEVQVVEKPFSTELINPRKEEKQSSDSQEQLAEHKNLETKKEEKISPKEKTGVNTLNPQDEVLSGQLNKPELLYREETIETKIDFQEEIQENPDLAEGTVRVKQEGKLGKKVEIVRIFSVNKEEVSREIVSTSTTAPSPRIVEKGTKKTQVIKEQPETGVEHKDVQSGAIVEPAIQPELPEAVVSDKGVPEVQPALSEAVVTDKGETEVQPESSDTVVSDKGEPKQVAPLPEYKGNIEQVKPETPVEKTKEQGPEKTEEVPVKPTEETPVNPNEGTTEGTSIQEAENPVQPAEETQTNSGKIANENTGEVSNKPSDSKPPVEESNQPENSGNTTSENGQTEPSNGNSTEDVSTESNTSNSNGNEEIKQENELDPDKKVEEPEKTLELRNVSEIELYSVTDNVYKQQVFLEKLPSNIDRFFVKVKSTTIKDVYLPVESIVEETKDGKHYAIYNLKKPLFESLRGATIEKLSLKNVSISGKDDIGSLANEAKNGTTINEVHVDGLLGGERGIGGLVAKVDQSNITNSSFTGRIVNTYETKSAYNIGGLVGHLTGDRASINSSKSTVVISSNTNSSDQTVGGIAGLVDKDAHIQNSYSEGDINNSQRFGKVAGIAGNLWDRESNSENHAGRLTNVLSDVNVTNGNAISGYHYNGMKITDAFSNKANKVFNVTLEKDEVVSKESFEERGTMLDASQIASKKVEINLLTPPIVDPLSTSGKKDSDFSKIAHYQANRALVYKNIEKLLPFYNKATIVKYGNLVKENSILYQKELLSAVMMKDDQVITDIISNKQTANKLLLHYKDHSSEKLELKYKDDFANLAEYSIGDSGLLYTPNQFLYDQTSIINQVLPELNRVNYQSDAVRNTLGISPEVKLTELYLEEQFTKTKQDLANSLKKLLSADAGLAGDNPVIRGYLVDKIKRNKEALLLGMSYLERWYNFSYGQVNVKDLVMYHPDFFGKGNTSPLDTLIELGKSGFNNLLAKNNVDTYAISLASHHGTTDLFSTLENYRKVFLPDKTNNDWFKSQTKAYIVEEKSNIEEVKTKQGLVGTKYSIGVYDRITSATWKYRNMVLPLLTLPEKSVFVISTISSLGFGAYDRYRNSEHKAGKDLNDFVEENAREAAKRQRDHYDYWYRILDDNAREKLYRNILLYDAYKFGDDNTVGKATKVASFDDPNPAMKYFFGPVGNKVGHNGHGAYATGDAVYYMGYRMLDKDGAITYTHEMTHDSDQDIYLGGYGRRSGLGPEFFAKGLLQAPDQPSDATITINSILKHKTSDSTEGQRLQVLDPTTRFNDAADLQNYVHNMFDVVYMLEYLEGQSIVKKLNVYQKIEALRKIENKYVKDREDGNKVYATNVVQNLTEEDANKLTTFDSLIKNNILSAREYKAGTYERNGYFTIKLFAPIFSALSSEKGTPGDLMGRRIAYELLAAKGFKDGMVPYISNQYEEDAKQQGQTINLYGKERGLVTDELVLKKVFDGKYKTWAEFKTAMYQERVEQFGNLKQVTFKDPTKRWPSYGTKTINNVDELQKLMDEAVLQDATGTRWSNYNPETDSAVHKLKRAIFKAYLDQTNDFRSSIFENKK
ncbi:immunoglobulin A1 protease [Streptococcus pneumoniae]|nr:immunoglobulin A1 protease [Streptococcus pneumoniae]VPT92514.1 immunoglobulin A1 protease [Streptococcus pneumoniae]